MARLEDEIDSLAERTGFSGVVHVEAGGRAEVAKAYGMADRVPACCAAPSTGRRRTAGSS